MYIKSIVKLEHLRSSHICFLPSNLLVFTNMTNIKKQKIQKNYKFSKSQSWFFSSGKSFDTGPDLSTLQRVWLLDGSDVKSI